MKTLVLISLLCSFSSVSQAGLDILSLKEMKGIMGNFPAKGSAAEILDDQTLLSYQHTRTQQQCDTAGAQSNLKLRKIFVQPNGPLLNEEFNSVYFGILKLEAKVGINVFRAKEMYKRQRPYVRNSSVHPCIKLENSYSYPSGHSAISRAAGRFLADRFPDRAEEIMKKANQVASNRVLGGVHHPSDIDAGRKLGDEIAYRIIQDRD